MEITHGGDLVAEVLKANGVQHVFTLAGGHISSILVAAKARDIQIIDTRHEASAVFAADVVARLTGTPGVAAVTAGPGVTNTITAIKNAQMAESAIVLIGGSAPSIMQGKGALQDIDQLSIIRPIVKWAKSVRKMRDIVPMINKALEIAQSGVPGPVFLEFPIDVLYPEDLVHDMFKLDKMPDRTFVQRLIKWYLNNYLKRMFHLSRSSSRIERITISPPISNEKDLIQVLDALSIAERPILIVSSQATLDPPQIEQLADAVKRLNIPVYLTGMARGLLGKDHPLHMRHKRSKALKEADVILLAGAITDFRMDYGRVFSKRATVISINRSKEMLNLNRTLRKIDIRIQSDPGQFLKDLTEKAYSFKGDDWYSRLKGWNDTRVEEINKFGETEYEKVNPIKLCMEIEKVMDEDSLIIGDGGDFVGTMSYIMQPRVPMRWLDPGVFGTLGTGGGFAVASKLLHPNSEVWLIYGDGSCGYTIAEFDTMVRHNLPVIAIVGNDASWQQIARGQLEFFNDDVAMNLRFSDYQKVAEGYGAKGILVRNDAEIVPALLEAKRLAKEGHPVLVNVLLATTDFRKGSISV